MAPKTIKGALADTLEDLSKENFDKFCFMLLDRQEGPRVRRRQVEGKDFLAIADLLVSVYTESRAHLVAVDVLKDIDCRAEAADLERVIAGLSSKPGSSGAVKPSAGACADTKAEDKHFVDEHKRKLIEKISPYNVAPILDELLDEGVILQEQYDEISALSTSQQKIRALYNGCLKSGPASKDVFYKSLEKNERYLIEHIKKS